MSIRIIFFLNIWFSFYSSFGQKKYLSGTVKELHASGPHTTKSVQGVRLLLKVNAVKDSSEIIRGTDSYGHFDFYTIPQKSTELLIQYGNWIIIQPEDLSNLLWLDSMLYPLNILMADPNVIKRIEDDYDTKRKIKIDSKYLPQIDHLRTELNRIKDSSTKNIQNIKDLRDSIERLTSYYDNELAQARVHAEDLARRLGTGCMVCISLLALPMLLP